MFDLPKQRKKGVDKIAGRYPIVEEWLTDEGLLRIEGWARDGLTDKQIAVNKIGIAERTFSKWKAAHDAIRAALKKGKAPADTLVENALYKRALGFTTTETIEEIYEEDGVQRKHIRKVTREVPPDVTAQIFWLKNRKPVQWRDKREVVADVGNNAIKNMHTIADLINAPQPDIEIEDLTAEAQDQGMSADE